MGVFLGLTSVNKLHLHVKRSSVFIIIILTFSLLLLAVMDLCVAPLRAVL